MKKLAIAAAAAAALSAGVANAYTVGTFSNGFVVPNVIHNGATDTTVVGLINRSGGVVPINWVFFDQNSVHVRDGCFGMTNNDYEPFVWSQRSGLDMNGRRGYLVFAVGTTAQGTTAANVCDNNAARTPRADAAVSANAFQVNTVARDVAYLPVVDGPLVFSNTVTTGGRNLRNLEGGDLISAAGAVNVIAGAGTGAPAVNQGANETFTLRYFIDQAAGGRDTAIVIWSTGDQRGNSGTVLMYNDTQQNVSVNLPLPNSELNIVNPETIPGREAAYLDGFIEWPVTAQTFTPFVNGQKTAVANTTIDNAANPTNGDLVYSVHAYSVITAPDFGAVQTLLGAHQ